MICVLKNAYKKFNLQVYARQVEVFTVSDKYSHLYNPNGLSGRVPTVYRVVGLGSSNNHWSASHLEVNIHRCCRCPQILCRCVDVVWS